MIANENLPVAPHGFNIREANLTDVSELTQLWYDSFNKSHQFWNVVTPDDPVTRKWWNDTWTLGIKTGSRLFKTFVVEDLSQDRKLVAFARWNVPQKNGEQDIPLPPYPTEWNAELTEAFWGGMPKNRRDVMGRKSHWMLEFLGVDQGQQKQGLGFALVQWGCEQADEAGLDVYLDATIMGLPFYKKCFGFQERKLLPIPSDPITFGNYHLVAVVRPSPVSRASTIRDKGVQCTVMEIVDVVA